MSHAFLGQTVYTSSREFLWVFLGFCGWQLRPEGPGDISPRRKPWARLRLDIENVRLIPLLGTEKVPSQNAASGPLLGHGPVWRFVPQ
jgi:hypothetical protein